jgi:hypothetical protein
MSRMAVMGTSFREGLGVEWLAPLLQQGLSAEKAASSGDVGRAIV